MQEDLESFFLQWDEFVKTDLRSASWMCHVIGQARVKCESNRDFEREDQPHSSSSGDEDYKGKGIAERRGKRPPSRLCDGDFSLGITVHKIVLLEKVLVEVPTITEMEEQRHVCFLRGHEEPVPKSPTGTHATNSSEESFASRFSQATKSRSVSIIY